MLKKSIHILTLYKIFLLNYWVILWFIGFLIATLIGTIGIVQYLYQKSQSINIQLILDTIYYTISMATLSSLPEDANNTLILIGKTLSPLMLIVFSVSAVLSLLKDRFLLFWAHLSYSGHYLVCGLSRGSLGMIQTLREKGNKVVVLEDKGDNPLLSYCKIHNIPYMVADGGSLEAYNHLRFKKAKEIILFWEEDTRNVYIARELNKKAKEEGKNINIQVHISNIWLKHYYDKEGLMKEGGSNLLAINLYENMARAFFLKVPLDSGVRHVENPWIVIVGDGITAKALLIWTILYKVYPEGKELKITVVGESSKDLVESFKRRYTYRGEFMFEDVWVDSLETKYRLINCASDLGVEEKEPQAVFVCTESDEENMRIYEELKEEKLKVYCFLNNYHQHMDSNLLSLYKLASELTFSLEEYDRMAKVLHNMYLENCDKSKEACRKWEELKEVYRVSNRLSADHIWEKLRYIGLDAVYTTDKEKLREYKESYERALKDDRLLYELIYLEHMRYYRERVILRDWNRVLKYKGKWQDLESRGEIMSLTKDTLESYVHAMEELINVF